MSRRPGFVRASVGAACIALPALAHAAPAPAVDALDVVVAAQDSEEADCGGR